MAGRPGPGLWGQLLEFMGMSYPPRSPVPSPEVGPECPSCGNPTARDEGGRFACRHHPQAVIEEPPTARSSEAPPAP